MKPVANPVRWRSGEKLAGTEPLVPVSPFSNLKKDQPPSEIPAGEAVVTRITYPRLVRTFEKIILVPLMHPSTHCPFPIGKIWFESFRVFRSGSCSPSLFWLFSSVCSACDLALTSAVLFPINCYSSTRWPPDIQQSFFVRLIHSRVTIGPTKNQTKIISR